MATEHEILIRHHDEILALAQTGSGQGFYVLFIAMIYPIYPVQLKIMLSVEIRVGWWKSVWPRPMLGPAVCLCQFFCCFCIYGGCCKLYVGILFTFIIVQHSIAYITYPAILSWFLAQAIPRLYSHVKLVKRETQNKCSWPITKHEKSFHQNVIIDKDSTSCTIKWNQQ